MTGTYDGSEELTITIPEGGSGGSTGGGLRKMSAVSGYIGIPAAELPQDGTVWMCISKGDGAELYSGTVTIEGGSLTANNLIAVSSGSVIQFNQATIIGVGFVIYGMSATDYVGVWQQVGAGSAAINWRGEWAEATKYSKLDAVSYEGSSYIFASDTPATGAIPGIDGEWQLMAQGGGSGTDLSLGVTGATVGQIAKISAVDDSGKPTAWEAVDMPSGGGDETNFQLVFNQECVLDADVSEYEVNIGFGLQDFKEFIALVEYSASTNDVYQDEITFDGVIIESFGGTTAKGYDFRRIIYAKRVTQTEYIGIHRAGTNIFSWAGGNMASTLSYFNYRIKTPTGKLEIRRTKSTEASTITIKLYKR